MPAVAMHAIRRSSALHRSLPWLLWLALLLPMAQSAAAWHAWSHGWHEAAQQGSEPQAPHAERCDLCLTAAALSGGALRAAPPALALAALRHELPPAAAGSAGPRLFTPVYQSRAPPFVSR